MDYPKQPPQAELVAAEEGWEPHPQVQVPTTAFEMERAELSFKLLTYF